MKIPFLCLWCALSACSKTDVTPESVCAKSIQLFEKQRDAETDPDRKARLSQDLEKDRDGRRCAKTMADMKAKLGDDKFAKFGGCILRAGSIDEAKAQCSPE